MAREVFGEEDTKLKKNALIYKKRSSDDGKEEYKKLDGVGKLRYFRDYYLKTILIVILIVAVGAYYVVEAVSKPATILYIAIENDYFQKDDIRQMEKNIETYLSLDGKRQTVVINTDYSSRNLESWQQLQTYLYSGSADIVIADKEAFTTWAECGYFLDSDSSDVVSFYKDIDKKDRLYTKFTSGEEYRGEKEQDNTLYNFGISIKDSKKYQTMGGMSETVYAGISNGSKHQEEAAAFLKYLLNDKIEAGSISPEFAPK